MHRSVASGGYGNIQFCRYGGACFFKKIKIDPAVASGPLITTINDLVAVVAYYGIVWALLINILGLVE